jgi:hypothetical protein
MINLIAGGIFMKKILILVVSICLSLGSCAKDKHINSREYSSIGIVDLLAKNNFSITRYDPNIRYEVCWGNVILGAILVETVIAPIYFYGFSMYNPIDTLK